MAGRRTSVTVGAVVAGTPPPVLWRTLPAALGQAGVGPLRLLVVDDASAAETTAALGALRAAYPAIEVLRNDRPTGLAGARNRILECSDSDYLAWLDPGLAWRPRRLELQHARLAEDTGPVLCEGVSRRGPCGGSAGSTPLPLARPYTHAPAPLRSAMQAALTTTLGRTATFRDLGGFDEALGHLADLDLLVRFFAHGGRMVSVDSPDAAATIAGARALPAPSRSAALAFHRKHRDLERRAGRSYAARCRIEAHRSEAEARSQGGDVASARWHRRLAELLTAIAELVFPPPPPTGAAEDVTPSADGRAESPGPAARRSGARSSTPTPSASSAAESRGSPERADELPEDLRRLVTELARSGRPAEAAERLRAHEPHRRPAAPWTTLHRLLEIEDADDDLTLEVLEVAHRELAHDSEIARRLIEEHARRERWEDAIERWERLPDMDAATMTTTTATLLARSYRALGRYLEAVEIAERCLARWPDHVPLFKELRKSRVALTDWSAALSVAPRPTEDTTERPPGRVSSLGVLGGAEGPITGFVCVETPAPTVSLVVNGRPVASTRAVPSRSVGTEDRQDFSISAHQLHEYLGDGDALAVECQQRTLPIGDGGSVVHVATGYPSRFEELERRLSTGSVFTKFGKFRKGNTPRRKRELLDRFDEVGDLLEAELELTCYPLYGNLLGAVRDHDFIPHDVGGFDMGYVSRERRPAAVRAEMVTACRLLLDRGFTLVMTPWAAMVRRRWEDALFVDLNYCWVQDDEGLGLSYGWRYEPAAVDEGFAVPRECPLGDRFVRVPGRSEELLHQIYGASWPIPDQGFTEPAPLVRAEAFLLSAEDLEGLRSGWPTQVRIESVL